MTSLNIIKKNLLERSRRIIKQVKYIKKLPVKLYEAHTVVVMLQARYGYDSLI